MLTKTKNSRSDICVPEGDLALFQEFHDKSPSSSAMALARFRQQDVQEVEAGGHTRVFLHPEPHD